jgi:hypothetical protein
VDLKKVQGVFFFNWNPPSKSQVFLKQQSPRISCNLILLGPVLKKFDSNKCLDSVVCGGGGAVLKKLE